MVVLNSAVRIGIIAEDKNDIEVMYELTCKLIKEKDFSFLHFVGHGCGKLKRKCRTWAENLLLRGCSYIVVLHDLDRCDENQLRNTLELQLKDIDSEDTLILIPVEELEAWLLSDAEALKSVFNMKHLPKIPYWPEKIAGPKEFLATIVKRNSNSQYVNTIHNRSIARKLSVSEIRRCPSFSRYSNFLATHFSIILPPTLSSSRKRQRRRS